jgi:arylsulfatase A-like enzyme
VLLTGQYSSRCGVLRNGDPLPIGTPTWADAFGAASHRTSFVGKWHLGGAGNGPIAPSLRGGFADFIGYQCYNGFYRDVNFYDEDGCEHHFDRHRTDVTTDIAIERLERIACGPFSMVVSYQAPHYPVQPAPEFDRLFQDMRIQRRPNCREIDPYTGTFSPRSPQPAQADPDWQRYGNNLDEYLRLYHAFCSQIDANVGRLLAALDRLGLADNTAVFYTSDHGDLQGSHGLKNKSLPYEESSGIPLVVRVPGGLTGRVCDSVVSAVDFLPTCLELAGVPVPEKVDGRSFAGYLRGVAAEPCEPAFIECTDNQDWCMICRGPWKLVAERQTPGRLTPTMMFDVKADPYEMCNLVEAEASAGVRAELLQRLRQWDADMRAGTPVA